MGIWEHGNEPSVSITESKLLDQAERLLARQAKLYSAESAIPLCPECTNNLRPRDSEFCIKRYFKYFKVVTQNTAREVNVSSHVPRKTHDLEIHTYI